ncbi:hypothetical protein E6W39_06985 [Kitasatospora acidiphila]|uniref:Spore-associated protein A n=1 Tax=Kitasatospora acidiphila TaxID=2567942 RepID=A0A540VZB1_9ACTN|nr:hypothetical protein [Kitasatospora acidiphila]TQF02073.1 hypothetical protein E6W39_06985 [Kitasatospora acidiphila]
MTTACLALAAAGTGVAAAPANAASSPADAICGPGYYNVGNTPVAGAVVAVEYNGYTNCVVTLKTTNVGTPTHVWAYINLNGLEDQNRDDSTYSYYAGPRYVDAPSGQCIYWGGGTDDGWAYEGPGHCG